MFLIDLNQIILANLLLELQGHTNVSIEENMMRHMVLNTIRYNRQKFKSEYGEPILCCDNMNYWRKTIFPHYKANRKKIQEKSELNWNDIFIFLNKIKQELKTYFPYKVIEVETAEADDIIGTIIHEYGVIFPQHSGLVFPILILSADKDFIQLQIYRNVKQYDPIRSKWISHDKPDHYLFEHILKGDTSDGIPNVLSDDDCLVVGVRQKSMTKKRIGAFYNNPDSLIVTHWERNRQLIDLEKVPKTIKDQIMIQFHTESTVSRDSLIDYFVKYRLKNLLQHLGEF